MGVYTLGVYTLGVYSLGLPILDLVPHTLGVYNLGVYTLGVYSLQPPIWELAAHLLWGSTLWGSTRWGSNLSSHRFGSWQPTYLSLSKLFHQKSVEKASFWGWIDVKGQNSSRALQAVDAADDSRRWG